MSKQSDNSVVGVGLANLPKKYNKMCKDNKEFLEIAEAASVEELKKIILIAESNIKEIEKSIEESQEIQSAREVLGELVGPYKDGKKMQTFKIKVALCLMEDKGTIMSNFNKDEED